MKRKPRISLVIPEADRLALLAIAETKKIPLTKVIDQAIKQYLNPHHEMQVFMDEAQGNIRSTLSKFSRDAKEEISQEVTQKVTDEMRKIREIFATGFNQALAQILTQSGVKKQ